MFQTFTSRHNSNCFSDKLVLTSVTPAASAPVLQTPKATSSTLYFHSWTVNAGNGGFLHCIFFFSSRRRHTRCSRDWSSDVCSSDLFRCGGRQFSVPQLLLGVLVDHHVQFRGAFRFRNIPLLGGRADQHQPRRRTGMFRKRNAPRNRSEEHTSELQSRLHLVCRLLL